MKNYLKILLFFFLFIFGCSPKPEPVFFGTDSCNYCAMRINDHRYGGLILTEKNKSYKFDSLECLMNFEAKTLDKKEKIKARYVFNTFKKGELVKLEQAIFLKIPNLRSPMGEGIWASDSADQISKAKSEHDGEVMNWAQLQKLLQLK